MDQMDKKELDGLLERMQFKPLPYDVGDNYLRLQQNIKREAMISAGSKTLRLWRFVGVAASFALLIMTSLYLINLPSVEETMWYEVTAVPDAKTKVMLPDGSTVWLNANASLSYPRAFERDKRDVQVWGDAMFEVQKGEKPFYVELDGLRIKVLGTIFNVVAGKQADQIEITLLEGKIALYKEGNTTDTPDQILEPGEQALYNRSLGDIAVSEVRTEAVSSWVTGNFHFVGNTLTEIATELERAFHTKIHIENEAMQQKTFNAVFEDHETLDEILSILQISARYTVEKKRGEVYIH